MHDLRAPLAAIRSQCERLESQVGAEQAEEVHRIARAVETMCRRVDTLLEQRAPSGPPAPVDLTTVALEVAERLRPLARIRDVTIAVSPAPGAIALGDAPGIDRALQNLVENAIRHSPNGETVRCTVGVRLGSVTVTVDDAGPGVPEADRERVLHAGVSGRAGGTGLGLAIADGIARAHGGRVLLRSAPAGGARAVFELPASRLRPRQRRTAPARGSRQPAPPVAGPAARA